MSAHVGAMNMYRTLRKSYYWPSQSTDCYAQVIDCSECARERLRSKKLLSPLKTFPAKAPLEDIAMDLLEEFDTSPRGNRWLLVIVDRYSKLTRTIFLISIGSIDISRAFTTHGYSRMVNQS